MSVDRIEKEPLRQVINGLHESIKKYDKNEVKAIMAENKPPRNEVEITDYTDLENTIDEIKTYLQGINYSTHNVTINFSLTKKEVPKTKLTSWEAVYNVIDTIEANFNRLNARCFVEQLQENDFYSLPEVSTEERGSKPNQLVLTWAVEPRSSEAPAEVAEQFQVCFGPDEDYEVVLPGVHMYSQREPANSLKFSQDVKRLILAVQFAYLKRLFVKPPSVLIDFLTAIYVHCLSDNTNVNSPLYKLLTIDQHSNQLTWTISPGKQYYKISFGDCITKTVYDQITKQEKETKCQMSDLVNLIRSTIHYVEWETVKNKVNIAQNVTSKNKERVLLYLNQLEKHTEIHLAPKIVSSLSTGSVFIVYKDFECTFTSNHGSPGHISVFTETGTDNKTEYFDELTIDEAVQHTVAYYRRYVA